MNIWNSEILLGGSEPERAVGKALDALADTLSGLNLELAPQMCGPDGRYSEETTHNLAQALTRSAPGLSDEEKSLFDAFFYCLLRELTTQYDTFRLDLSDRGDGPATFVDLVKAAAVSVEQPHDATGDPERKLVDGQVYERMPIEMPRFCTYPDRGMTDLYEVLNGKVEALHDAFDTDLWVPIDMSTGDWGEQQDENDLLQDMYDDVEGDAQYAEWFAAEREAAIAQGDEYAILQEEQDEWRQQEEAGQRDTLPKTMPEASEFVRQYDKLTQLMPRLCGPGRLTARDFETQVRTMVLGHLSASGLAPASQGELSADIVNKLAQVTGQIGASRGSTTP